MPLCVTYLVQTAGESGIKVTKGATAEIKVNMKIKCVRVEDLNRAVNTVTYVVSITLVHVIYIAFR